MTDKNMSGNSAVVGNDRRPTTYDFEQAVEVDRTKYIVRISKDLILKIYGATDKESTELKFKAVANAIARAIHLKKAFTILAVYYDEDWYWGVGHHYDNEYSTAVVLYTDTVTYYYNYRAVDRIAEIVKKPDKWVVVDIYKKKTYATVEVVQ